MKKEILKGIITKKEQLKNSSVGGPRVRVWIKSGDRELVATTATNSGAGYLLTCSMAYLENKDLTFEAHTTRTGALIINRIISGYYEA